jgi:hypothetical protein
LLFEFEYTLQQHLMESMMALSSNIADNVDWKLMIKNTFVEIETPRCCAEPRSNSAPASSRFQQDDGCIVKLRSHIDSDVSTDFDTESTICSECGSGSPASLTSLPQSPVTPRGNPEFFATAMQPRKLNSKAPLVQPKAMQPKPVVDDLASSDYKNRFMEVLDNAKAEIQKSSCVEHLDVTNCDGTWCFVVRPSVAPEFACQTDEFLEWLEEVFLGAAQHYNGIYLMGFANGGCRAFTKEAQGFSAIYGAMDSSRNACWHVFKKGFCKHGADCGKQHPVCQVPVRVLLEKTSLNGCPKFMGAFKQEVADLSMAAIVALQGCGFAEKVEAFKDKDSQGWTIEVTPKEEVQSHKDFLLDHAKSVLLGATACLSLVCIIGHATQPFLSKGEGFATMIGAVMGETVPCADFFVKGCCTRHTCRYAHPDCLMPFTVTIKEKTSLTMSPAMLQYVAQRNLSTSPCSHPAR